MITTTTIAAAPLLAEDGIGYHPTGFAAPAAAAAPKLSVQDGTSNTMLGCEASARPPAPGSSPAAGGPGLADATRGASMESCFADGPRSVDSRSRTMTSLGSTDSMPGMHHSALMLEDTLVSSFSASPAGGAGQGHEAAGPVAASDAAPNSLRGPQAQQIIAILIGL